MISHKLQRLKNVTLPRTICPGEDQERTRFKNLQINQRLIIFEMYFLYFHMPNLYNIYQISEQIIKPLPPPDQFRPAVLHEHFRGLTPRVKVRRHLKAI